MKIERIQDRALGKWRSILPALGVSQQFLTNKHGPCPLCGGRDRYRFDDKAGSGSWICSHCGAGSGVDLVMRIHNLPFLDAKKLIEQQLPSAVVVMPKAAQSADVATMAVGLWRSAQPLTGNDPASWYLVGRGIKPTAWPTQLRFLPRATYIHDDKRRTQHPAMLALFAAPDASGYTVHTTFLDPAGRKAQVPIVRKLAPGKIPPGGAVRLAPSADTMGIAEGIETALSASALFGVPVWAALTAGALLKWQPPATARHVIVFGDHDQSFTGQHASYSLAYRLKTEGLHVEVRLPDEMGTDWNDVLGAERTSRVNLEAAE